MHGGPKPARADAQVRRGWPARRPGAVTLTTPGTIVAFFVTAPTPITFGEIAGRVYGRRVGPALPFANTIVTPAATAWSAAWIIGSGQASVFW